MAHSHKKIVGGLLAALLALFAAVVVATPAMANGLNFPYSGNQDKLGLVNVKAKDGLSLGGDMTCTGPAYICLQGDGSIQGNHKITLQSSDSYVYVGANGVQKDGKYTFEEATGGVVPSGVTLETNGGTVNVWDGEVNGDITNTTGTVNLDGGTIGASATITANGGTTNIDGATIDAGATFNGNPKNYNFEQATFTGDPSTSFNQYVLGEGTEVAMVKVQTADGPVTVLFGGEDAASNAQEYINTLPEGEEPLSGVQTYTVGESGASTTTPAPNGNAKQAVVTGFGFEADANDANAAIAKIMGVELNASGQPIDEDGEVTSNPSWWVSSGSNVMWATFTGSKNASYSGAFTRAAANNQTSVAFSTGGSTSPYNDKAWVMTDAKGNGVIWFTVSSATTPAASGGNTNAADSSGAYKSAIKSLFGSDAGAYTVTLWPTSSYDEVDSGSSTSPINVTGVDYSNGLKKPTVAGAVYGLEGTSVNTPTSNEAQTDLGFTNTGSNDAPLSVTNWTVGTETIAPGGSYTLPAPAGAGKNVTLTAQWGTQITLSLAGSKNFGAVADSSVDFAVASGNANAPYTTIDGATTTYVLGAAANNTVPELPVLVPGDRVNSTTTPSVFVGWFIYNTETEAYQAVSAGDSIADLMGENDTSLTLYPIVTELDVAWDPSSADEPSIVIGSTGSFEFSAEMSTKVADTNLSSITGVKAVPEASEDATELLNALVSANLSEAYEAPSSDPDATSATGLANVVVTNVANNGWATIDPKNVSAAVTLWDTSATVAITLDPAYSKTSGSVIYAGVALPAYGVTKGGSSQLDIDVVEPIQVTVSPAGAGTVQQAVNANNPTLMDLTAVANNGYKFVKWTNGNGATLSENPTYTVKQNPTDIALPITAVFESSQVAVERLYNPYNGEHLVSANPTEIEDLEGYGWENEGVAWYAPSTGIAVYRLYNPYSHDHYYTTKLSEYESLQQLGWLKDNDGQPVFYGSTISNYPVYQLFNPYEQVGTHLWTTSVEEYDAQAKLGWVQENVVWYAANLPATDPAA